MNWDDLRLFLAVARTGSISAAARSLKVQHSTVSRRMSGLEKKLGVRLLERKKSGYELTPAGETLRLAASNIEHEIFDVDARLLGGDTKLSGELHIATTTAMASGVLMPIFSRFKELHPDVEMHIVCSNRNVSLVEREADIAIRQTNTPPKNLIGCQLGTMATAAYGNREYLGDLEARGAKPEWLGVSCCGFHRNWTKKASGVKRHGFYTDDVLLTMAALKTMPGLAYLPCADGDRDPELERYAPPDPEMNLGLWLLYHPDLQHTVRVQLFRDYMLAAIGDIAHLLLGER
ncbi:LysR family transcriptional regulator [Mariprofundus erugo]|uniref:LysR family transcriptional regulator n=1 Tax=Mariprofundus erugo TaxID=2528639 RepID=UPI0010FE9073|nr:LysR family transcriptional regulator [Mariprofundus erugo]TLS78448.1 LysR family transcriptional regulator [Mariprofundus erugo]